MPAAASFNRLRPLEVADVIDGIAWRPFYEGWLFQNYASDGDRRLVYLRVER